MGRSDYGRSEMLDDTLSYRDSSSPLIHPPLPTLESSKFPAQDLKLDLVERKSFVEQLENAFKTPAKVDLRYGMLFNKG